MSKAPVMYETSLLAACCSRITDGSHFSPTPREAGLPIANVKDMRDGYIDLDTCTKISQAQFDLIAANNCVISSGMVLLSKDGSVGKVVAYRQPETIAALSSIALLSPLESIDANYLAHTLNSHAAKRQYENFMSGSALRRLVLRDIRQIIVPFPDRGIQSKIAEILDNFDAAIRGTEAVVSKLKAMKQGLLHDLLTRGIDANGDLRPTKATAPHLYKQTPLGWLPKEWDVDHLSTFASVHGGKRLPAGHAYASGKTGFKYLRVKDFFGKSIKIDDLEDLEERTFRALTRYEIRAGQLYISIAGSLGHVGVFPQSADEFTRTILTENAARIVLQKDGNPEFLAMMMNSVAVQQQVEWEKGTGGGVPKLALFRIAQFFIGFPALPEQDAITKAYHEIVEREVREEQLLDKLRLQKSGLMEDLLTGRKAVTALL